MSIFKGDGYIKTLIGLSLIAMVVVILAITNPDKDAYLNWYNETAMESSDSVLETGATMVMKKVGVFEDVTTSTNYVIFSVYTTSLSKDAEMKAIAIFNNFIPIQ